MTNALSLSVPNTRCTDLTSVPVEKIAEYGMYFFYTFKHGVILSFLLISLQTRVEFITN